MITKIEQIIGEGAVSAVEFYGKDLTEHIGQAILGRLDAAGLGVLPKEATDDMVRSVSDYSGAWRIMARAFDPTTYGSDGEKIE